MIIDESCNTIRFKTIYPTLEKFTTDYDNLSLYVSTVSIEYVYKSLLAKFANRQIRYVGIDYFKQSFMYDLGIELTDYDFKVLNQITSVDVETITSITKTLGKTQNSELTSKQSPQDLDITLYESGKEVEVLSGTDEENSTITVKDKDRLEIQNKINIYTRNYFKTIFKNLLKHFSMNDYYEGDDLDYGYTE